MFKKLFLSITTIIIGNMLQAQVGNEVAGGTVTPISNDPAPYTGAETLLTPGSSITEGDYNVLIGDGSGGSLNTSDYNTFIGTGTGALLNGSADDNVVIGAFAADQTTTSIFDDNVVIGARAGRTLAGGDNIVVGTDAGAVMTSANDNVIIGNESGNDLTEGDDNIFMGDRSGYTTTTGNDNVFIGDRTGYYNTTGNDNVFIGEYSGYYNTTGEGNTFVGATAGDSIDGSSGYFSSAGEDNTTGTNNTALGASSGADNGAGSENTFVGAEAGARNEHANYNTFIGYRAGVRNNVSNSTSNAVSNTFIGWKAADRNEEGMNNVVIGANADFGQDGTNNSILIGYQANTTGSTDRDNVVLLGANATATNNNVLALGGNTNVTGSYSTAIGAGASATANNSLVLGGNTTIDRVSVGIATSTPSQNASLDLADTDKGLLVNRVTTTQRNTMTTTPASGVALGANDIGLMVYDTDDKLLYIWNGTQWGEVGSNAGSGVSAVPDLLNYQSAVRDNLGNILANQPVSFRMNVVDVTLGNTTVYSESHSVTTSDQGLVNFEIGNGAIVSGLFTDIDWSHNNSLQIELDATGGSTYVVMGSTSFVSVPYALRAKYAENLTSSTNARLSNSSKDDRIETLEAKILTLEKLVNQLIKKK